MYSARFRSKQKLFTISFWLLKLLWIRVWIRKSFIAAGITRSIASSIHICVAQVALFAEPGPAVTDAQV